MIFIPPPPSPKPHYPSNWGLSIWSRDLRLQFRWFSCKIGALIANLYAGEGGWEILRRSMLDIDSSREEGMGYRHQVTNSQRESRIQFELVRPTPAVFIVFDYSACSAIWAKRVWTEFTKERGWGFDDISRWGMEDKGWRMRDKSKPTQHSREKIKFERKRKGNCDCKNDRRISLLSVPGKVFGRKGSTRFKSKRKKNCAATITPKIKMRKFLTFIDDWD